MSIIRKISQLGALAAGARMIQKRMGGQARATSGGPGQTVGDGNQRFGQRPTDLFQQINRLRTSRR